MKKKRPPTTSEIRERVQRTGEPWYEAKRQLTARAEGRTAYPFRRDLHPR